MKSMFRSDSSKALMLEWYERFHDRLCVPTERRTVNTRCGETHVLVGGRAESPPVVLLHGAMASSAHVMVEAAPLLDRYRIYAVDVMGQSPKSADYRPSVANQEYGQWLGDVMDALELPRAHLVGISWGGFVSLQLAALSPQRIERLVLMVPAGIINTPAWTGFKRMGLPLLLYRLFPTDRRLQAFLRNLLTTTDDDWASYLRDALGAYRLDMRVPPLIRPGTLDDLTAPTLVIAADGDASFPGSKLLKRASELIPSLVGQELLSDSNHCPPTTDEFRAWMSERIGAFLDGDQDQSAAR